MVWRVCDPLIYNLFFKNIFTCRLIQLLHHSNIYRLTYVAFLQNTMMTEEVVVVPSLNVSLGY